VDEAIMATYLPTLATRRAGGIEARQERSTAAAKERGTVSYIPLPDEELLKAQREFERLKGELESLKRWG